MEIAFALIRIAELRPHEDVDPARVERICEEIRRTGQVEQPLWVDRETRTVLNGHHRLAALRRLGATRAPAWVVDYFSAAVHLGRWRPGPPIDKAEVIERARSSRLFPVQTTRHELDPLPPPRPTPLRLLLTDGS